VSDIVSSLPALVPSTSLVVERDGVLIACAGFEERALSGVGCARFENGARAVLVDYLPANPRNRRSDLEAECRQRGAVEVLWLLYDRFDPKVFVPNLELQLAGRTSVIIDISAMSKLAIILCLEACSRQDLSVTLFYTEAAEYGPSQADYEKARAGGSLLRPSLHVDTGVHGVLRTSSLSSVAMQGQPNAAIAFMSFNELLTQVLINSVNPGRLLLINGRPPHLRWREGATAWIHEQLRSEWPDDDNPLVDGLPARSTSTLDYRETVGVLLDLYWRLATDHRIIIAPTGSKMQAVACYVVHAVHPDVQVEYPTPEGFLDLYSSGVGRSWSVCFGKIGQAVRDWTLEERRSRLMIGE